MPSPPPASGALGADSPAALTGTILYLFSGPSDREGSLGHFVAAAGIRLNAQIKVQYVDLINGEDGDMADQCKFEALRKDVSESKFMAVLSSPPCSTFAIARGQGRGPRKVRGVSGPDRYGLAGLKPHEKDAVRLGTLLACRAFEISSICHDLGIPWLLENPTELELGTSIFKLDEWLAIGKRDGVFRNTVAQCNYGLDHVKLTDLRGSIELPDAQATCTHVKRDMLVDGVWQHRAHAPLRGLAEDGSFRTRATAAYPSKFNKYLAEALVKAAMGRREVRQQVALPVQGDLTRVGRWGNTLVLTSSLPTPAAQAAEDQVEPSSRLHSFRNPQNAADRASTFVPASTQVTFVTPLRGAPQVHGRAADDARALGGLRGTAGAVDKLAFARVEGAKIRAELEKFLDAHPDIEESCISAIGSTAADAGPSAPQLALARLCMAGALSTSPETLQPGGPQGSLAGHLLQAWATRCGDPDIEAATWAFTGAPAGILEHPAQIGVFPDAVESAFCLDPMQVEFDDPEFRRSYESVERDDFAWVELHRLVDKGYVTKFSTLKGCIDNLNGDVPVVSKFGMIVKEKHGVTKRRLILDAKESGVTECGRKNQRIMLPHVINLVYDVLSSHAACQDADLIEWLVLDITDAFWTLGLRASERRFFVGKLRGLYFLYNRLAQGSRGAPLAWCRFFALVSRLTVALFTATVCKAQVYVDDPAFTFTGSAAQRRRCKALVVLVWRCVNLDLAFKKGQCGAAIDWIGCRLRITKVGVIALLQSEAVREMQRMVSAALGANVVSEKVLRSLAGKLSNAARVLTAWRPFLGEIWAALAADPGSAPPGCIWTRQVAPALLWFAAFLDQRSLSIMRPFLFKAFVTQADRTMFVVDASPWGYGAVLVANGVVIEYFSAPVSEDDCHILGIVKGSPDSQQICEALAMLIALRVWRDSWRQWRSAVAVRGDNVTMLTMVLHFKGTSKSLNIIAREVALEVAASAYRPLIAEHIAGVANITADALSRLHVPGGSYERPACLAQARAAVVPERPRKWYRALAAPAGPP